MEKPPVEQVAEVKSEENDGEEPKFVTIADFEPTAEDIVGPEFNPPYRFIFGKEDWNEKERKVLSDFKERAVYETMDKGYWNDPQLLR